MTRGPFESVAESFGRFGLSRDEGAHRREMIGFERVREAHQKAPGQDFRAERFERAR